MSSSHILCQFRYLINSHKVAYCLLCMPGMLNGITILLLMVISILFKDAVFVISLINLLLMDFTIVLFIMISLLFNAI